MSNSGSVLRHVARSTASISRAWRTIRRASAITSSTSAAATTTATAPTEYPTIHQPVVVTAFDSSPFLGGLCTAHLAPVEPHEHNLRADPGRAPSRGARAGRAVPRGRAGPGRLRDAGARVHGGLPRALREGRTAEPHRPAREGPPVLVRRDELRRVHGLGHGRAGAECREPPARRASGPAARDPAPP